MDLVFWKPLIKEYLFIHPFTKGFFIVEIDLAEYTYVILDSIPWFWRNKGFFLMPWNPCFNPLIVILTLDPVLICLPNLPLNSLGEPSLNAINSALGKFHFISIKTSLHFISSYARIGVEIDFSKWFPTEIVLNIKNYS
jgi:hypothetical protein